ncbi:hypothetical protein ACVFYP_27385 [Roseomonas sp. F4]
MRLDGRDITEKHAREEAAAERLACTRQREHEAAERDPDVREARREEIGDQLPG